MLRPSTPTSRNLTVSKTELVDGFVLGGVEFVIDPPVLCEPGKRYRVDLDLEAGTATVREDS
jgi:hypothetical protein